MTELPELANWLLLWMAIAVVIQVVRWKRQIPTVGLVLAYVINLWLLHWVASALYLLPWYVNPYLEVVTKGLEQSVYGLLGFAIGTLIGGPALVRLLTVPWRTLRARIPNPRLVRLYVATGFISYTVLLPIAGLLPTVTALVAASSNLLVVGVILGCWQAWRVASRRGLLLWILALVGLPFFTIVTQGFVSYGIVAVIAGFAFLETFIRPRWVVLVATLVVTYIGLSFFVTYTRDREAIREVVWGGEQLDARIVRVVETMTEFELFDVYDVFQLRRIDARLNQNLFVGIAVDYLGGRSQDFAHGETLVEAAISLIPRALWPDKPTTAGSGDLVSRYTGIAFAQGTSVGIGQVMELYINFGTTGVIVGFLVLGTLLAAIDQSAARRLRSGDWTGFTLRYLPGYALLNAGGSLVEMVSSAGAGIVLAVAIRNLRGAAQTTPTVETPGTSYQES